jgi:hypothetical protein
MNSLELNFFNWLCVVLVHDVRAAKGDRSAQCEDDHDDHEDDLPDHDVVVDLKVERLFLVIVEAAGNSIFESRRMARNPQENS